MKLLVTGGAGYIGSVVTRMLLDAGHEVVVLDDLRTGHRVALAPDATHVDLPVHEAAQVVTPEARFDGVLHFAALIAAGESMVKPELYWHTNTVGTLALLDAVRAAGVPRLVFSSTAAVYGNPTELPIPETAVTAPTNTYGATKLAVDMALTSEAIGHGLAAVSLRYFNVAGAHLDGAVALGERHDPETHLIPIALEVAAGRREKLQLFGDDYPTVDGTCVRDYIHVADLARAHLLALDAATPASTGSTTSATATGSPTGRSSTSSARSPATRCPSNSPRAARATPPNWWPPPAWPARNSAGCRRSRPCTTWSATPGSSTAPTSWSRHDRRRRARRRRLPHPLR